MTYVFTAPRAAFLLRFALGGLLIVHAGATMFAAGGTGRLIGGVFLPHALLDALVAAEFVAGAAVIFRLWSRVAILALVPIFLGVMILVHSATGASSAYPYLPPAPTAASIDNGAALFSAPFAPRGF